ncbi:hypothetical protein HNR44_002033 [Geomicrobium halophilum]|uniref:Uncharacterized protein n=1 Tax=Geomicrobium halophilum TaxID=549000 RepID=A0A841PZR0_9BACL|nr:hypothetical protein [Geomicrobium halophilum]
MKTLDLLHHEPQIPKDQPPWSWSSFNALARHFTLFYPIDQAAYEHNFILAFGESVLSFDGVFAFDFNVDFIRFLDRFANVCQFENVALFDFVVVRNVCERERQNPEVFASECGRIP